MFNVPEIEYSAVLTCLKFIIRLNEVITLQFIIF